MNWFIRMNWFTQFVSVQFGPFHSVGPLRPFTSLHFTSGRPPRLPLSARRACASVFEGAGGGVVVSSVLSGLDIARGGGGWVPHRVPRAPHRSPPVGPPLAHSVTGLGRAVKPPSNQTNRVVKPRTARRAFGPHPPSPPSSPPPPPPGLARVRPGRVAEGRDGPRSRRARGPGGEFPSLSVGRSFRPMQLGQCN